MPPYFHIYSRSKLNLLRSKMRNTSLVRSPVVSQPSQSVASDIRTSRAKEPDDFTIRAVSGSSNSTSSSSIPPPEDIQAFKARPKLQQDSDSHAVSGPVSLQEAFAARRRKGKSSSGFDPDSLTVAVAHHDTGRTGTSPGWPETGKVITTPNQNARNEDVPIRPGPIKPVPVSRDVNPQELEQCSNCGRKFNQDVISRHQDICCRQKKRSPFDSRNHRLSGLATNAQNNTSKSNPQPPDSKMYVKKATWRDKSDQLRAAIGAARATDPRERMHYEQELARANQAALTRCDYCGRSFNSEAAQRHIPICRNKASMIPRQIPGKVTLAGTGASLKVPPAPSKRSSMLTVEKVVKLPSISNRGYSNMRTQSKPSVYRSTSSLLGYH